MNWPTHEDGRRKKIGEMTQDERRAVTVAAASVVKAQIEHPVFQAELQRILAPAHVHEVPPALWPSGWYTCTTCAEPVFVYTSYGQKITADLKGPVGEAYDFERPFAMRWQMTRYNRLVAEFIAESYEADRIHTDYLNRRPGGACGRRADLPRSWDVPVGACVRCGAIEACEHDVKEEN